MKFVAWWTNGTHQPLVPISASLADNANSSGGPRQPRRARLALAEIQSAPWHYHYK
jgi:hypothetical protein